MAFLNSIYFDLAFLAIIGANLLHAYIRHKQFFYFPQAGPLRFLFTIIAIAIGALAVSDRIFDFTPTITLFGSTSSWFDVVLFLLVPIQNFYSIWKRETTITHPIDVINT